MENSLALKQETFQIIGACLEVYKEKVSGFPEQVYQECLEIELGLQNISFEAQKPLKLGYKGRTLKNALAPNLICLRGLLVEVKVVTNITDEHRAQFINYLNATSLPVGLLVNFGHYPNLEYERLENTKKTATIYVIHRT
jgi:GxxExxY protein